MKNIFEQAIEFKVLYKALKQSCRNVRWKDSIAGYEWNGLRNTYNLKQTLLNNIYKISKYQKFLIHEPKEREIIATRIKDRQFQRALCNAGLYEDIIEHFIHDNGACLVGKGIDFCLRRLTRHLRKFFVKYGLDGWVLKCDIHHYFPETSHDVAYKAICKRVKDPKVREEIKRILDSFGGDKGIGLGSQVSQLIELAVLDDLDHFIKEKLRIKFYIRYMDDFVLIHPDKEYLKYCWKEIDKMVQTIGLQLNKKTNLVPLKRGIKFLQWKFIVKDTGKILRLLDHKKRYKQIRKMKKLLKREAEGTVASGTLDKSLQSFEANAKRGDTFLERCIIRNIAKELQNGIKRN